MPPNPMVIDVPRGLDVGDRIPNFILPDHTGQSHPLYEYPKGRITVLLVLRHPPKTAKAKALLTALLDALPSTLSTQQQQGSQQENLAQPSSGPHPPCAIAILPQSISANAALHQHADLKDVSLWSDQGPVIEGLLGTGGPATASPAAQLFVLDENLRIRAIFPHAGARSQGKGHRSALTAHTLPSLVVAAIRLLDDATPPQTIHRVAPVLLVPDVLTPEECDRLIQYHKQQPSFPSGMSRTRNGQTVLQPEQHLKRRMDCRVDDPTLNHTLMTLMARRLGPELRKVFHFEVKAMEAFKIVRYESADQGFFAPHRDNNTPEASGRRFALTLPLSPRTAYDGGELRFLEYGSDCYRPDRGEALIFSCSNLHEVRPVTQGTRYVLLSFFLG